MPKRVALVSATAGLVLSIVLGSTAFAYVYRAIVTLKWLRNGNTDGLAKVSMDYYSVKWTVGDPAFVFSNYCTGVAD